MHIEIDDLSRSLVHQLLEEHLADMYAWSPADQVFALDLTKLKSPDITFFTAWEKGSLLGCGALKEISFKHGEVKSMRTSQMHREMGVGRGLLEVIIKTARQREYEDLSLETGTHPAFEPAHNMYKKSGFVETGPFGSYVENLHSKFFKLKLK